MRCSLLSQHPPASPGLILLWANPGYFPSPSGCDPDPSTSCPSLPACPALGLALSLEPVATQVLVPAVVTVTVAFLSESFHFHRCRTRVMTTQGGKEGEAARGAARAPLVPVGALPLPPPRERLPPSVEEGRGKQGSSTGERVEWPSFEDGSEPDAREVASRTLPRDDDTGETLRMLRECLVPLTEPPPSTLPPGASASQG